MIIVVHYLFAGIYCIRARVIVILCLTTGSAPPTFRHPRVAVLKTTQNPFLSRLDLGFRMPAFISNLNELERMTS